MLTVTATELKNRTSEFLDRVLSGAAPIVIERNGRSVAVLMSVDEYKHLARIEDSYWVQRAEKAEASGYASPEESYSLLKKMMEPTVAEGGASYGTNKSSSAKDRKRRSGTSGNRGIASGKKRSSR